MFVLTSKKNRMTHRVLKGWARESRTKTEEKLKSKKRVTRESRERESWDKEPQSPSLQCHLMFVLQGAIQQLNLVDHNDIYKDIYVTICKSETNICIKICVPVLIIPVNHIWLTLWQIMLVYVYDLRNLTRPTKPFLATHSLLHLYMYRS